MSSIGRLVGQRELLALLASVACMESSDRPATKAEMRLADRLTCIAVAAAAAGTKTVGSSTVTTKAAGETTVAIGGG